MMHPFMYTLVRLSLIWISMLIFHHCSHRISIIKTMHKIAYQHSILCISKSWLFVIVTVLVTGSIVCDNCTLAICSSANSLHRLQLNDHSNKVTSTLKRNLEMVANLKKSYLYFVFQIISPETSLSIVQELWIALYKSTILNMGMVKNFDVVSDKFNLNWSVFK